MQRRLQARWPAPCMAVMSFVFVICASAEGTPRGQASSQIPTLAAIQTGPAQQTFEVVSLRPSPPNSIATSVSVPQGAQVREVGITLLQLLAFAYGLKQDQISAPPWASSQMYDLEARTTANASLTLEQMRPLLQNVLKDRFSLKVHHETRLASGYDLLIEKSGSKLRPATPQDARSVYFQRDGMRGTCSLSALAALFESPAGKPIVDRTDLKGDYSFQLSYAPADAADSSLPSFFTAVKEQLGLRLVPARVPVEQLVLEQANRVPADN